MESTIRRSASWQVPMAIQCHVNRLEATFGGLHSGLDHLMGVLHDTIPRHLIFDLGLTVLTISSLRALELTLSAHIQKDVFTTLVRLLVISCI